MILTNFLLILAIFIIFFFNDTATTEIYTPLYTLSLHDALPIYPRLKRQHCRQLPSCRLPGRRSEEHTSELQSHSGISYAVFCLKKKKKNKQIYIKFIYFNKNKNKQNN